ncbi:hypothetical protein D3C72_1975680 [compost metagenome]
MSVVIRRGYGNCYKTLEVIDGKIDLVIYNNKGTSFFYYRFDPESIIGEAISKERYIVYPEDVRKFFTGKGKDYDKLIEELLEIAMSTGMEERDEM